MLVSFLKCDHEKAMKALSGWKGLTLGATNK
jgi:hypothetical protein